MIRTFFLILLTCLFYISSNAFSQENVVKLDLYHAYFIEGPENFQPSGLTIINGNLYTVSDKHDDFIYSLKLSGDIATAIPAVKIKMPVFSLFNSYDFEGITHDQSGNLYLASESKCRILKITPDDEKSEWITPDLKTEGEKSGLFQISNAYLEGICSISPEKFIVCAERQQRGLLEINVSTNPIQVFAYACEKSQFIFPENTNKDFSGMCRYRQNIYVLERNAYLFSQLKRENNQLVETRGWSYRHIETALPYRYADIVYGKAEGLCINDKYIFIIIDNNNGSRAVDSDDFRPMLMVFTHPENFISGKP